MATAKNLSSIEIAENLIRCWNFEKDCFDLDRADAITKEYIKADLYHLNLEHDSIDLDIVLQSGREQFNIGTKPIGRTLGENVNVEISGKLHEIMQYLVNIYMPSDNVDEATRNFGLHLIIEEVFLPF